MDDHFRRRKRPDQSESFVGMAGQPVLVILGMRVPDQPVRRRRDDGGCDQLAPFDAIIAVERTPDARERKRRTRAVSHGGGRFTAARFNRRAMITAVWVLCGTVHNGSKFTIDFANQGVGGLPPA